jgi:hypothetical protein
VQYPIVKAVNSGISGNLDDLLGADLRDNLPRRRGGADGTLLLVMWDARGFMVQRVRLMLRKVRHCALTRASTMYRASPG